MEIWFHVGLFETSLPQAHTVFFIIWDGGCTSKAKSCHVDTPTHHSLRFLPICESVVFFCIYFPHEPTL